MLTISCIQISWVLLSLNFFSPVVSNSQSLNPAINACRNGGQSVTCYPLEGHSGLLSTHKSLQQPHGVCGDPVPNSVGLPCAAQTLKIVITTWFAAAILEVGCSCDFECLSTCWGSLCGAGAPRRLLQPLMSTSKSLRPSKAMQPSRLCC